MISCPVLIDYLPKGQTINVDYDSSLWCKEGYFEGKTPREDHKWSLVLARKWRGSPATCNPEETALTGLPIS
jgi:hypothetical protein